uniref:Uncharacterized protein n=1 Tax=Glossina pallidipes TaxID=7398 RepID=A0A1A9ZG08_GLOPL
MSSLKFLSSAHLPTASTHPNVQSPLAATTLTSNSSSISPSPAAVADVSATSSNSESSAGTLTPDAASQTSALGSTSASTVACSSTDLTANPYTLTAANLTSSATSSTSAFPAPPCCNNGRPMITDPVTGQSVCSCQYEPNPSSRLAALGSYSRLTSATPITAGVGMSVFGSTYPSNDQNPYPSITVESATPFYTSLQFNQLISSEHFAGMNAINPFRFYGRKRWKCQNVKKENRVNCEVCVLPKINLTIPKANGLNFGLARCDMHCDARECGKKMLRIVIPK